MRNILVVACALALVWVGCAADYYFDGDNGSDDNTGADPAQAMKSLDRLAKVSLNAGDVVCLKRGCTFRGPLRLRGSGAEGRPIRVTAFGDGAKPEILGSIVLDGWEAGPGEVFTARMAPEGFIGRKKPFSVFEYDGDLPVRLTMDKGMPTERGHFFFDEADSLLHVITSDGGSPAKHRLEVPVIDQILDLSDRAWIEIENLSFLFGNCRHIGVVRSHDITIADCASLFVGLYGNPNVSIHRDSTRVSLLRCFLYENVNCGVFISSGATRCRVADCTIMKCASNDGITCHSGGRDAQGVRQGITGDHNIIERNVIGLCPEESIDITSGDHHIIRENICYRNGNPGIIVGHDSDHILIQRNICFENARSGIQVSGNEQEGATGGTRVIQNLVYENAYPGLEIDARDTQVLNNTVINSRQRTAVRVSQRSTGLEMKNNIIATLDPTIAHPSLHFIRCSPSGIGASLSHNLYRHAGDRKKPHVFFAPGELIRTVDGSFTLDSFAEKYGTGRDSLAADPGLAGVEQRLYFLAPGTPAIDAGADVGLPFSGAAPDLGWCELGSEAELPRYPDFLFDGVSDADRVLKLWGKRPAS